MPARLVWRKGQRINSYQVRGTGSIPVTSSAALTGTTRSIGNGQCSWYSFARESLERSGLFPILTVFNATLYFCQSLLYYSAMPEKKVTGPASYFPSIEKKYGKPIEYWMKELKKVSKLAHMEQVAYLKENFEIGHGHANAIVHVFRAKNGL